MLSTAMRFSGWRIIDGGFTDFLYHTRWITKVSQPHLLMQAVLRLKLEIPK